MNSLRIIRAYYSALIKEKMEFRASFIFQTIVTVVGVAASYASILIILNRFDSIGDWNSNEVLLLYSIGSLCYSVSNAVLGVPMKWLGRSANQGELDSVLIRPVDPLLQIVLRQFSFKVAPVIMSLVVFCLVLIVMIDEVPLHLVILVPFSILGGIFVEAALMIMIGSLGIVFYDAKALFRFYSESLHEIIKYPLNIFPTGIRLFALIIPLGFVSYVPIGCMTDHLPFGAIGMLSPVAVGILSLAISHRVFSACISRYASSGT